MLKIAVASKQELRGGAEVNSISQKANVLSEKGEHASALTVANRKACWVGRLEPTELEKPSETFHYL